MSVTLTRAEALETLWVMADRIRFAGVLPGTDLVVAEVTVPPGAGTPMHAHASPELFRVMSGILDFETLEDGARKVMRAGPGDVLRVAPQAPHGYANAGETPAEVLVVLDRTMEAFFREIGSPEPAQGPPGPEDFARIGAACARHGIAFVEVPKAA
ncbi:cupin domain-containing protein [Falsiroseomonas sp. HW251]|uniref:cupin domain-containing protein n=1 Tax=Falsiroseomonas sp. HW251 TaxID=3390998 RepID=UPI003D321813